MPVVLCPDDPDVESHAPELCEGETLALRDLLPWSLQLNYKGSIRGALRKEEINVHRPYPSRQSITEPAVISQPNLCFGHGSRTDGAFSKKFGLSPHRAPH